MKRHLISKELILFVLISLFFVIISSIGISYIGGPGDELAQGNFSIYLLKNIDINLHSEVLLGINFFGKYISLPTNYITPYSFSLHRYILIPIFLIFGTSVLTIKITSIFVSWTMLLVIYLLIKNLFDDKKIALLTIFFLSISPNFIHYSRLEFLHVEFLTTIFFFTSIYLFWKFYKKRKIIFLFFSSLFLGLGFSIKLSIVSRIIGLLAVGIVCYLKPTIRYLKNNINLKNVIIIIVGFTIGSFLFISYNIKTEGVTFKLVRFLYKKEKTFAGVNNRKLLNNFKLRLNHLLNVVSENIFWLEHFPKSTSSWYLKFVRKISIENFLLLLFSLILSIFIRNVDKKKISAIFLFYFVMFFTTLFSPGSMVIFHMMIFLPFPQFLLSNLVINIKYFLSHRKKIIDKIMYILSITIILFVFFKNIQKIYYYHRSYFEVGDECLGGKYSRNFIDYLVNNNITNIYFIANLLQIHDAIPFITNGKVKMNHLLMDIYKNLKNKSELNEYIYKKNVKNLLLKKEIKYIILHGQYFRITLYDKNELLAEEWFKDLVKQEGLNLVLLSRYVNKENYPIFELYEVKY